MDNANREPQSNGIRESDARAADARGPRGASDLSDAADLSDPSDLSVASGLPAVSDASEARVSLRPRIRRQGLAMTILGGLVLATVSLTLSTWGLSWGMPSDVSWAPDTVAGTRTLAQMGRWPDGWRTHYPPFHFFINDLAYAPMLEEWQSNGQMKWVQTFQDGSPPLLDATPGDSGVEPLFVPPAEEKIARLIIRSRWITVFMSLGAVLATAGAGWLLFGRRWVGFCAGLTLATCAEWTYFSHLGNLDIPHMFWFSLSLLAYIQAWRTDRAWCFAVLGVLTAVTVATKDAVAGMYVGMALVLIVGRVIRARRAGAATVGAMLAAVMPKLLLGLVCCAVPYALIQGLFVSPRTYWNRLVSYYIQGRGIADFNQAYEGPLWLAREAIAVAAKALGWPLLIAMGMATVYSLVRKRREALIIVTPCVTYYLVICSYAGLVYARMLFPVYACLAILLGHGMDRLVGSKRVPAPLRYGTVFALFALSFGYCAAVDLDMTNDTRYRAEEWLVDHVRADEAIGVFAHRQYLPRLPRIGRRSTALEMTRERLLDQPPPYVLLVSHNYDDFTSDERECMAELLAGRLGYGLVASFQRRFLPPNRWLPAIAGWGTRGAGKVSPTIHILERTGG